ELRDFADGLEDVVQLQLEARDLVLREVEARERRYVQNVVSRDRHDGSSITNKRAPFRGPLLLGSERKARQAERSRPERPWGPARPRTQHADPRSAICPPPGRSRRSGRRHPRPPLAR